MLGGGCKASNCRACSYVVDMCVLYFHGECRELQTPLQNGKGCLGNISIDTLDFSIMKKITADSKAYGMEPGSTQPSW